MARSYGDIALAVAGMATAAFFLHGTGDIPQRSFGDPLGARLMPMLCAGALLAISAFIGAKAMYRPAPALAEHDVEAEPNRPLAAGAVILAAILYTLAMPYLGYYVSTWLFTLFMLALGRPGAWLFNIAIATVITLIFGLVFVWGLSVAFPRGSLVGF